MRLSLDAAGRLVVGGRGGRGAWLCRDSPQCVRLALRRQAIGRALRTALREEDVRRLHTLVAPAGAGGGPRPPVCEDGGPGRRRQRPSGEQEERGT